MFQYHFNVDLSASRVGEIKNHFKYVSKGTDCVTIRLVGGQEHYDEIEQFYDARYFSAHEVLWRLFQFEIIDKHPSVVQLDGQLEIHHTACFSEGQTHQSVN